MINLKGEKVNLRSFTREEYHELWKSYVADPVMDPQTYVYDNKEVDERFDIVTGKADWYPRVGIFLPEGRIIGELSFKRINCDTSQCELGIAFANDSYKGMGYGTEAFRLAIDYVFNSLKLKYIYADTMSSNIKMQRILHRFGFQLLNIDESYYDMGSGREDRLNYVLKNTKEF